MAVQKWIAGAVPLSAISVVDLASLPNLDSVALAGLTATATASWTTASTTLTVGTNPGALVTAGWSVFDSTTSQTIGTVSTYSGTSLVLTAVAAFASSGSADVLQFVPPGMIYEGSAVAVQNSVADDTFLYVHVMLAAFTSVAPNVVNVFYLPLNPDGSFGDGQFVPGTLSAKIPSSQYFGGSIMIPIATTTAAQGSCIFPIAGPFDGLILIQNTTGGSFAASGNIVRIRTLNLSVA
jgi:hypothetical protein